VTITVTTRSGKTYTVVPEDGVAEETMLEWVLADRGAPSHRAWIRVQSSDEQQFIRSREVSEVRVFQREG